MIDPVQGLLLVIACIFLIGIAGELVFERTGVPDVVWLIGVGALLGPISGLVSREQLMRIAPHFGAITLVIVLFNGGISLRLAELRLAAPRATALAVVGFFISAVCVAVVSVGAAKLGLLPDGWTWLHGLLLGSILGGSSSVVIMPSVEKARLDGAVANLLNLESALTDILCVVFAGALTQLLKSGTADGTSALLQLARAFGIGLAFGGAAGFLALRALRRLVGAYAYPLTLAALMLLYVLVDLLGGSPALAILTAAVIVGNAPALAQTVGVARSSLGRGVTTVHQQMTFMVKSFFFTLIGAMLGTSLPSLLLGLALGAALLVARWPAVRLALARSGQSPAVNGLVWVALPRGMAAGVLSMLPAQAGVTATETLPGIVFAAATTTIVTFAVGFRFFRARLLAPARPAEPVGPAPAEATP